MPEGLTAEDKERALFSIAHEYFHHIEYMQGKTHNEEKAEEFACQMVCDYKSGKNITQSEAG